MPSLPWRTGRSVGRTIYDATGALIGVMDTPELAAVAVAAANSGRPAPPRTCEGVWIDPGRLSGTPCVGGTHVPVYMVVGMVWASGVDEAMDCWDLTRGQVLNACWYAAAVNVVHIWRRRPPHGLALGRSPWRRRWLAWAEQVKGDLWASEYGRAADPPSRDETP